MIEILTREQFANHFDQLHAGLGDEHSPLWEPEHFEPGAQPSHWFVYTQGPAQAWSWDKNQYWSWCRQHCQGSVLCYSASDEGEWWGFERREDILIWSLRWVG
jgi:hypothetical protein